MEIVSLVDTNVATCAGRAAEVLRMGGVVLYPTDTLYGLGVDAFSDEAVAKLYDIKNRADGKPIHCIVSDIEMAEKFGEVDGNAHALAKAFLPGPLTLILKKKLHVATGIARDMKTIGIRIPLSEICIETARLFGNPFTTTSANRSGEPPQRSVEKILEQLDTTLIDLVIDAGVLPESKPSSVVDVSNPEPVILREGAIGTAEIWDVLRTEP